MTASRRSLAAAAVAALLLQTAAWIFWFPEGPDAVFRAVPAYASLVIVADQPADKAEALLTGEPARLAASAAETVADLVEDSSDRRELVQSLGRYGGRRLAVSMLSEGYGFGATAWTFAAWQGWKSVPFRWALTLGLVNNVHRLETLGGSGYWAYEGREVPAGYRMTLGIEDGFIYGVLTRGPMTAGHLQKYLRGQLPSAVRDPFLLSMFNEQTVPEDILRGWFTTDPLSPGTRFFRLASAGRLPLEITVRAASVESPTASDEQGLAMIDRETMLAARFSRDLLPLGLADQLPEPWSSLADGLVEAAGPGGDMVLIGAGGERSGRIKGVRIPLVAVAVRSADPKAVREAITRRLAAYAESWGAPVYLEPRQVGARELYTVKSDRKRGLFDLSSKERPAVAFEGDWVLAGTGLEALAAVADDLAAGASDGTAAVLDLERPYFGWVNLDDLGGKVKAALQLYSMKAMFDARGEPSAEVRAVKQWIGVLDALRPFKELGIRYEREGEFDRVDITLGKPQPAEPRRSSP